MQVVRETGRVLRLVAALAVLAAMGCSEPGQAACQSTGGFTAACRSCDGDIPFGPNASREACAVFGESNDCECATLSGSCSNADLADKAVCLVSGCTKQATCPVPQ